LKLIFKKYDPFNFIANLVAVMHLEIKLVVDQQMFEEYVDFRRLFQSIQAVQHNLARFVVVDTYFVGQDSLDHLDVVVFVDDLVEHKTLGVDVFIQTHLVCIHIVLLENIIQRGFLAALRRAYNERNVVFGNTLL